MQESHWALGLTPEQIRVEARARFDQWSQKLKDQHPKKQEATLQEALLYRKANPPKK
jgi:hypothetical protein